jgi:hypothetical protein
MDLLLDLRVVCLVRLNGPLMITLKINAILRFDQVEIMLY